MFPPEGIPNADLVLLVTTRPTTGNTLAWAVACERDQWGRAIAGNCFKLLFLIDFLRVTLTPKIFKLLEGWLSCKIS